MGPQCQHPGRRKECVVCGRDWLVACLAPGIPDWHFLVSDTSLGFPKGYLCLGGLTLAWLPKSWVVHPNQSLKNCCNWLRWYIMVENMRRKIGGKKEPGKRLKPQNGW